MPPFRNPFGRKPPVNGTITIDENSKPPTTSGENGSATAPRTMGSRTTSALSIKPNKDEPNEFKLSVVNDNGVYLPPSPPEKKSFWTRSPTSTTTSSHRSMLSENEPFSISRESFESYRRSFDISARSPVYQTDTAPRQSLDSRSPRTPRSAISSARKFEKPQPTDEEGFEDVGLNDETKPKKRGLFSRFGDLTESATPEDTSRPTSSHRTFHLPGHLPGRKRGQSGQGAELGNIDQDNKPVVANSEDTGVVR
ncbi:MAG: hypothetical protein MMC33_009622 [Icmadophila ericetorum]|nr:hypothetical protein [Icmadophila ericetorum]